MNRRQRNKRLKAAASQLKAVAMSGSVEWLQAADGDEEAKLKRFSMVAYTGGAMLTEGFFRPVVVDLDGMDASNQSRPIFKDHDETQIVGHTDTVEKSQQRLKVSGVVSGVGQSASEVMALAKNGFPWQASIGASVLQTEFVDPGQSVKVNGRNFQGPLVVARKTVLKEVSFVPLGADDNTTASIAASFERVSLMEFNEWLKAKGFDPEAVSAEMQVPLKAMYDAELAAKDKPTEDKKETKTENRSETVTVDLVAKMREEVAKEETRIVKIRALRAKYPSDEADSIVANAIKDGADERDAELALLRAHRPTGPAIHSSKTENNATVIEAALCQSGGLKECDKKFDDKTLQAAHTSFRGGLSLQEAILHAANQAGYHGRQRISNGNIAEVLRAAFSTISLPGIFTNTANKFLMAAFDAVEQTWREIAAITSRPDFKTATTYRLTGDNVYEQLPPDGEIKHGTLAETSYTNQVKTYAKMLAMTRVDIINDDLNALTAIPRNLGRGGALKLNEVFWTEFMSNASFFTTARGNLDEGADTALSLASLGLAHTLFRNQSDEDGNPVAITPRILLVPNSLTVAAMNFMNSTQVMNNTTANTTTLANNPFAGMFKVVSSSYLSNTSISGYSSLAWYLLADPNDMPTIEVAFLNGVQTPTVESADVDFNQLGIQWRGYWDFGAGKQEYRGGVKMKGEA
jgi:hypothetical protein